MALSAVALAQSDYYYYDSDGSHINLNVFDSLVAVRFAPSHGGTAQAFASEQPLLVDNSDFEFIGNRTYVFRVESGYSIAQAMSELRSQESVAMVNPVAYNRYGDRWKMNNRLLVTYLESTSLYEIDSLESVFGLDRAEVIDDSLKAFALDYNQTTQFDITKLARDYFNTGLCLAVEPVITFVAYPASTDPYYPNQYQLDNVGQNGGTLDADIDWSESNLYQRALVSYPTVAVIDAGFESDHEDLAGNWSVWSYDAAGEIVGQSPTDRYPWNECSGVFSHCWHGTAVLGILKAATDNVIGLAGVEDRPFVMPIKIIDASGNTSGQAIYLGFRWARYNGNAKVICLTWNFPGYVSPSLNNLLKSCYDAGKAIVVATGNDGEVDYPANSPYVLAVGMSDRNDDFVPGSGVGSELDVIAPGKNVWTLDLMGDAGLSPALYNCDGNPNYMCNVTGTSFAAPLVTGVIAKMFIANPGFNNQSAEHIYEIIRHSADREPYGGGDGRVNDLVGWGRVNADRAVMTVTRGDVNNDGQLNVSDAVFIVAHIFGGGPVPVTNPGVADANCSGGISISDAVFIIAFIFGGGPDPRLCIG